MKRLIPFLMLPLLVGCDLPSATTPNPFADTPVVVGNLEPVVEAIVPPAGKAGDRVTITGSFFKSSKSISVFVTFNGYDAEDIELVDNHTIRATIPSSGTTGFLVVSLGNYRGNGTWYVVDPLQPGASGGGADKTKGNANPGNSKAPKAS